MMGSLERQPPSVKKMTTSTPANSAATKTNKPASWLPTPTIPRPVHLLEPDFFLTTTIIVKSIIGAGIIAIPYTIAKLGYIFAPIVLVLFLGINQLCSVLLLKNKNLSRHSNYATILYYIWRNDASRLIGSSIIFLDNMGTCKLETYKGILEFLLLKSSIRHIV